MAQWLIQGLTATISGVLTVFIVLILIAFIISQLKHIDQLAFWKKKKKVVLNSITANSVISPPMKVEDDLELIAVITAAIASSLNTSTDQLVVKSIRRVEGNRRSRRH